MRKQFLFVLLVTTLTLAQGMPTGPLQAKPESNATPTQPQRSATPANVPPDSPVITIEGLCPEKPAAAVPNSPDCKTVITRAEFEHLTSTLSPNMPPTAKQSFANDYVRLLVVADEGRRQGLENSSHYKEMVKFAKLQLLAQEMFRDMQEKAKPSTADVEKYYQDNRIRFQEISLKRLFIPRNRPATPTTPAKAGAAATPPKEPTDAELQAQGEKMRARLIAGEDFDKLEKEVYEAAGYKTPPPPTTIPNWRYDAMPASDQYIFDMKPKEFTKVTVDPSGAYIYQVMEKKTIPLADVKAQIEATMTSEHLRSKMNEMMNSVKPEINQTYFREAAGEPAGLKEPTPTAPPLQKPAPPATQGTNRPN
jgi:hypothetical protein